jgi:arylsulfatase A
MKFRLSVLATFLALLFSNIPADSDSRPNVIFILADDLGYGDLGWAPFYSREMSDVQTPNLKRMAKQGLTLTNFHTASPVCSPSRASIMVGLFPWRLGVDFIYAGDLKLDGSEELDHEQLPLIPNIAMSLAETGYYTAHIGKWHLGKIRSSK